MAVTQYFVLYKFMHPSSKDPITNTTDAVYGEGETDRFVMAYPSNDVDTDEVLRQKSSDNEKYDMLFMYDGVWDLSTNMPDAAPGIDSNYVMMAEKFERANGEAWFVASKHPALPAALNAAKPIVKSIGKDYVRVVKNVPLDITVGIE